MMTEEQMSDWDRMIKEVEDCDHPHSLSLRSAKADVLLAADDEIRRDDRAALCFLAILFMVVSFVSLLVLASKSMGAEHANPAPVDPLRAHAIPATRAKRSQAVLQVGPLA